jgi:16S rRNA (cytosine967-C5)-methyltransferase
MEVTASWVRALQSVPKLWLRARPGQALSLAKELGECWVPAKAPLADALIYEGSEDLFHTPEFHAGKFELQDISSQAVSILCEPLPGETWWDACAGEGGKLLHLSDLMKNQGLIWASDRAAWRLQKLKRRAARARVFNYRSVLWNGGASLPTKTKFDGVLLDAPCSGIGTWHRNPHARWTATLNDVRELSELQESLLAHAASAVKPGGKLVYAVCTLARAETTKVVASFEKLFPEFQPCDLVNPFKPGERGLPQVWFWPQERQGNGMFVAGWKKS